VRTPRLASVLFLTVVVLGAPRTSAAQGSPRPTGRISGVVRDELGGAIANVTVSIVCSAMTRTVSSSASGEFNANGLPASPCTVSAGAPGFSTRDASVDSTSGALVTLTLRVRAFAASVVVTPARGRAESTVDVPQVVSVIGRAEIDSRPFTLMPQVLREEPGILVQQTTTAQASPIIRGFTGQQNAYLIDGVRLNTGSWRGGPSQYMTWIDSGAVDRIEVVHGPGSVEYGSDAIGGTVNVMTGAPAFSNATRVGGAVELNLGSADHLVGSQAALSIQAPAASFRIGGSRRQVGDLRGGRAVDSHAAVTRFLGLPSAVMGTRMPATGFDQSGAFLVGAVRAGSDATLRTVYLHDELTGSSRYDRIEGGDGLYRSGFDPQRLDFLLLRYQRGSTSLLDDVSGTFSVNRQADGRFEQARPAAILDRQQSTTTALGYQLEGHKRVASRHQVGLGTEIYRESIDAFREQMTPATGVSVPNRPDVPDGTKYVNAGVFVNDTATIIPGRLTARGGLRYGRFNFSTVADPGLGVVDERVTMQAVTFNTGVIAAVTSKVSATFNVARGFRAANSADLGSIGLSGGGGFGITPSRAAALGGFVGSTGAVGAVSTGQPVPALGPEVVYSFEPGLRFQSERVSAAFTAYDMESLDTIQRRAIVFNTNVVGTVISGYQIVRQDGNGLAYIAQDIRPIGTSINADHARIRGFDADGVVRVSASWRARAFFAMTNGRLLGTGEFLRRMPPPMGGASARWTGSRVWIEATTSFAAEKGRFNSGDLTDARIGATRTRTSIGNYFNGTATDLGLVRNGVLLQTGETLAQVQQRVLGDAQSATLYSSAPGFVVVGARAGVRLSSHLEATVLGENLTDRNYRPYGSGADSPGANVQLRLRLRF
jgi:hemoglobin/transferrin/lactoferrin receptor protein